MIRPLFALGLALVAAGMPALAAAQTVDAQVLLRGLQRPQPLTRSMAAPQAPQLDARAQSFLRGLPVTRSLVEEDREELIEIAQAYELPRIDVEINFDHDVATPRADSVPDIVQIGIALTAPELAGQRFVLAGHTDGTGSAAYNLGLSQRRAESVRDFLIRSFGIQPERLIAVGFGFEQLKTPHDPRAAENRRVEIINLEIGWE